MEDWYLFLIIFVVAYPFIGIGIFKLIARKDERMKEVARRPFIPLTWLPLVLIFVFSIFFCFLKGLLGGYDENLMVFGQIDLSMQLHMGVIYLVHDS